MRHAPCAMLHALFTRAVTRTNKWIISLDFELSALSYQLPRNVLSRNSRPATRIQFLSDKRADVIELVLHGFHDHFKGIGFDPQAIPGEVVQGGNFIVPPVAHIEGPT